jgi:hypothetical protein
MNYINQWHIFILIKGLTTNFYTRLRKFQLRGILMWMIHDLQGYGMVVACQVGSYHAYPICGEKLKGRYSKALNKCVFLGHRCYLEPTHPYRGSSTVLGSVPLQRTGQQWLESCTPDNPIIKRKSIFFRLEYWSQLKIRHVVDGMHVEKNVCHNLMKLLLGE